MTPTKTNSMGICKGLLKEVQSEVKPSLIKATKIEFTQEGQSMIFHVADYRAFDFGKQEFEELCDYEFTQDQVIVRTQSLQEMGYTLIP